MFENLDKIESNSYENNYTVVRKKKRSALNVLLVNVGICLAVSLTLLLVRVLGGEEIITTFAKSVL